MYGTLNIFIGMNFILSYVDSYKWSISSKKSEDMYMYLYMLKYVHLYNVDVHVQYVVTLMCV